jgi:hypothetical protein
MEYKYQMQNKRFLWIIAIAAALLCVPFVAMRFTNEVNWSALDFVVAGVLLFGTGIAIEFALRMIRGFWSRAAVCGVILLGLFLVWAELAVGIFGTPFAGS